MTSGASRYRWLLFLVCVIGLGVRLIELDQKGIWFDEMATVMPGLDATVGQVVSITVRLEKNPPLHHQLIAFWSRVSTDLFWLRLSSVLLGVATLPAVAAIGYRLAGERTALVATLLAALNPFLVTHSQEVRMYALFGFGSAWTTYLFLDLWHNPNSRLRWGLYWGLSIITIWTHYLFGLLYFAQAMSMLLVADRRERLWSRWLRWQIPAAVGFSTLIPYFLVNLENISEGTAARPFRWWDPIILFRHLTVAYPNPNDSAVWVKLFGAVAAVVFALLIIAGIRQAVRSGNRSVLWIIAIPCIVVFAVSCVTPIYNPRYFIMIAPLICVLIGWGLATLPSLRWQAGALAAVMLLTIISLCSYFLDSNYRRADYETMSAQLESEGAERVYHLDYESFLADLWYVRRGAFHLPYMIANENYRPIFYWEGRSLMPADRIMLAPRPEDASFWLVVRRPIHEWEALSSIETKILNKIDRSILPRLGEPIELPGVALVPVRPAGSGP